MRILIEEHQYAVSEVKDILYGIDALENVEGMVSIHYVGYYYNALLGDCVFILPKVLLKDVNGAELVFGKYRPEDILHLEKSKPLEKDEKDFIYKFAVWIYRAIVVFEQDKRNDTSIVYHRQMSKVGTSSRRLSNTYLDILLSIIQWAKDNQNFVFTIVKNMHSGLNKINWNRTIATQTAIIQDEEPIYLNPVNKKRQVNFDEELLIIFYSTLNYIKEHFGFEINVACQFQLITGKRFETYINGFGKTRLLQIKYKYFSDKALQLWQLCFAFFDQSRQVAVSTDKKEYLLVKDFYIVFEAIIDELVADNPLPDKMQKKQEDGKIVDHLFTAQSLINAENKQTYYIGDSKYYKIGHELTSESIYKQYTYARNVIQYNLDLWNNGVEPDSKIKLVDDLTEGYNIIPNFFISAKMDEGFDYTIDGIEKTDRRKNRHTSKHFPNRLFDRDTLLLFHYDVNFLFVLALYARNNASHKAKWKRDIRAKFRSEIQEWLQQDFNFYAMKAHPDVNGETYIKEHFKELLGKVYTPFTDKSLYSLALDSSPKYAEHNATLLAELGKYFFLDECKMGTNPNVALENVIAQGYTPMPQPEKSGVLMVMMEQYDNKRPRFANGKIAIGIKYTKDSMAIVENLQRIGYLLFHTRKDAGQHLFAIEGDCKTISGDEIEDDRYKNIGTAQLFISVNLGEELDASSLHSSYKKYTPETRYDAQFEEFSKLVTSV